MKKNEPVPILFPRAASTLFDAKKGIKEYVFHLTSKIIQSIRFDNHMDQPRDLKLFWDMQLII